MQLNMKIKVHFEDYSEGEVADLEVNGIDINTCQDGRVNNIRLAFNLGGDEWEEFCVQIIKNKVVDLATLLCHLKDEGFPVEKKLKDSAFNIEITIPPYGDDDDDEKETA